MWITKLSLTINLHEQKRFWLVFYPEISQCKEPRALTYRFFCLSLFFFQASNYSFEILIFTPVRKIFRLEKVLPKNKSIHYWQPKIRQSLLDWHPFFVTANPYFIISRQSPGKLKWFEWTTGKREKNLYAYFTIHLIIRSWPQNLQSLHNLYIFPTSFEKKNNV
jgi:hypothetical protein